MAHARYRQSERGRARGRAADTRYRQTDAGRAACAAQYRRYRQTESGRAKRAVYQARYQPRYRKTEHGRAVKGKANAFRRARQVNAIVLERVDRRAIFVLDGGLCHLCDLPVDPQAFHIDHVVPLAVEPIEAAFNCAVAHASCNMRKGSRPRALSPTARARWQARRSEHLALLDQHVARHIGKQ